MSKVLVGRGRTKASQEKGWGNIQSRIIRFVEKKPNDQLATLIADLREIDLGRKAPASFYQTRPLVTDFASNIMMQNDLKLGHRFLYPDVVNKKYSVGNISPLRYLQGLINKDTTAVVELGSGWSSNLFQLYIGHGRSASKGITYVGAEFTKMGRNCANLIAEFDKEINYEDYDFNYREPNLDFLKKHKKHILVFTRHSIEQVDKISHDLYQQLYALKANVTLVHIEPTGWQRDRLLQKARETKDNELFPSIGEYLSSSTITEEDQIKNAAWWSWRLNYNYNLTSIIRRYINEDKIKLVFRVYDFGGEANILNPSSLYHLEFKN